MNRLEERVKQILEEHKKENERIVEEVIIYGCSSGVIPELITYKDTHDFYDQFYDEIEELRQQYEAETGESLHFDGDLKNFFAWFAFEEVAQKLQEGGEV